MSTGSFRLLFRLIRTLCRCIILTEHQEIMGQGSRRYFMCQLGLQNYLLLHYDLEFAKQSPEEFVKSVFVDALRARYVVIGDDVRFGHKNSGDLNTMRELGKKYGFDGHRG